MTSIAESRFRCMGVDTHVAVVDGPADAPSRAEARVRDLERKWSRFLPRSEITSLNLADGHPVAVSEETRTLIAVAYDAWQLTSGAFDPTVRPSVVASGYPTADAAGSAAEPCPAPGCAGIEIDISARTVRFPRGVSFDPGGIGKGLAADLVVGELLAMGAAGAMVNLGGDLRVSGTAPAGMSWTIAVEDPFDAMRDIWRPTLDDGGVATSSTRSRNWVHRGRTRHHLIDPSTGDAPTTGVAAVTVIAGSAWLAEAFTKVAVMLPANEAVARLDDAGLVGLVVGRDRRLTVTSRLGMFA